MPETRIPTSTSNNIQNKGYLQIEGQLLNGFTGEPIAGGNVRFSIRGYDEKNIGQLEQHRYATSTEDGHYRIENVSAKLLEKSRLSLKLYLWLPGWESLRIRGNGQFRCTGGQFPFSKSERRGYVRWRN
jgi:hypothetical protein